MLLRPYTPSLFRIHDRFHRILAAFSEATQIHPRYHLFRLIRYDGGSSLDLLILSINSINILESIGRKIQISNS